MDRAVPRATRRRPSPSAQPTLPNRLRRPPLSSARSIPGTASFATCSGPGNTDTPASPLADGTYAFRVQGTDQAGNSSVATRAFTVATPKPILPSPAPETTITKGPKKTRKTRPKFKFTSNEPAPRSSANSTRAGSRPVCHPSRRRSCGPASTSCRSGALDPEEWTPLRRSGSSGSSRRPEKSGRPDLNRGPHRPERCALPGCATPRGRQG